ncbi:hypothetical protein MPH_09159 [Macrophomina phaseolina MS6]|uniref:Uncharacterized protein n=1 Tax=Macrophomina phaseolina (strain MS6) TaxID=1126212 RepID=K2RGG2_MACPH|nr:hypothetical protein MPH_09159 [Macrophomina phaseolina MS6]
MDRFAMAASGAVAQKAPLNLLPGVWTKAPPEWRCTLSFPACRSPLRPPCAARYFFLCSTKTQPAACCDFTLLHSANIPPAEPNGLSPYEVTEPCAPASRPKNVSWCRETTLILLSGGTSSPGCHPTGLDQTPSAACERKITVTIIDLAEIRPWLGLRHQHGSQSIHIGS